MDFASRAIRKIFYLQGGAGSVKWTPDGNAIVAVSDIYPECGVDPACIKQKTEAEGAHPSQARVITSLLYRHWKAWQSPTRTHIVLQPVNGGEPRDLTPGAFDAPPFSLGGGDEFDVSPDGKEFVYARDTSDHPELKDPVLGNTTATAIELGVNYWYSKRFRATMNYVLNLIDGDTDSIKTAKANNGGNSDEHELLFRIAVAL